jgi:hypothetical protein
VRLIAKKSPEMAKTTRNFSKPHQTLSPVLMKMGGKIIAAWNPGIIRSWDGNINPDKWQFKVDGQSWLLTTFDNQDSYSDHSQAYPDNYGAGSHPPRTGAKENNTLGYKFDGRPMDAVYVFSFTIPHSSANLVLTFIGNGLTADFADEGWGVDNVTIYTIK